MFLLRRRFKASGFSVNDSETVCLLSVVIKNECDLAVSFCDGRPIMSLRFCLRNGMIFTKFLFHFVAQSAFEVVADAPGDTC